MQVFDLGLQFAVVLLGHPPAEDYRQLIRSAAQVAIRIEESFSHFIQGRALTKDQVFAKFHLGKEPLMPATVLAPFFRTKERNQAVQPFVPTAAQVLWG
jgi:hypothetical protein